ncbi:MAG TPA: DUF2268 domain-containing putative Zn-dependent protease [Candidatus Acidoferrales bacterium]|nr:DUF2268 domain-containing putative Zn-dependent protease [Candidatus Acidoferrales bacterium]
MSSRKMPFIWWILVCVLAITLVSILAAYSQSQVPAAFERAALAERLTRQALSKYDSKEYQEAGRLFAEKADDSIDPALEHYNAACAYSLAGQVIKALVEAELAIHAGFRDPLQMAADSDLAALRATPDWPKLVAGVEKNNADYQKTHSNPDQARIVTSDIDRFWHAYDLASSLFTPEDRVQAYRAEYFDRGSEGLVDYFFIKIRSIEEFVSVIDKHPKFYSSIRDNTLRVSAAVPAMRVNFRKMKDLYEDSVFPDVYFVVGSLTSAGTVSNRGLLLGVEQSAGPPPSALDELNPSVRAYVTGVGSIENITAVVAHELVHFQQKTTKKKSLLRDVLIEGSADFIGELASGHQTNTAAFAFGEAHQEGIWRRFEKDMHGTDDRDWIANGGSDRVSPDWVADLGYYVGYKISKGYYDRSVDKHRAIRDLLEFQDPDMILKESGYGDQFSAVGSQSTAKGTYHQK